MAWVSRGQVPPEREHHIGRATVDECVLGTALETSSSLSLSAAVSLTGFLNRQQKGTKNRPRAVEKPPIVLPTRLSRNRTRVHAIFGSQL